ncbi:MAG TPA: tetratricopeptide repeat protein [Planctomycetota bacterium]|nr:tetratricopeptide repeat protein [Planctomycetota bacterium]
MRRALPWLLTVGLVSLATYGVWRAVRGGDLVGAARALREGDPANDRKGDPLAALEVLDRLLADEPENVPALLERARAQQDLRAWNNAIEDLRRACDASSSLSDKILAKTLAMNLLAQADRYDDAVTVGEEIQALQPDEPLYKLRLGPIYLKGSLSAQEQALTRLMDRSERHAEDTRVETRVEAFVTDLWGDPDAAALAQELTPGGDAVVRKELADELKAARRRFQLADETLAGFRNWAGFDASVARAWCQVLLRSGRLFDAHVEAGMGLREPTLNVALKRDFLDVQTQCAIAVGDWAQAATDQSAIIEAFAADPKLPQLPYMTLWAMYEARIHAEQWDWILAHVDADAERLGDDPVLHWARAAALNGQGQTDAALQELKEPFATVSLGVHNATTSLRLFPDRRRAIVMLAYQLFTASGDPRAASALDALLAMDPTDAEALRLRCDRELEQGQLDAAAADAFALLVPERRDRADFDRWLDAADKLSVQRSSRSLELQARGRVAASQGVLRDTDQALYEAFKTLGLKAPQTKAPVGGDVLYVRQDPALTFSIAEELVKQGNIEQARTELRKLSDDYPMVQEFRFRLGRLLVREGQFEFAAQEFRKLLDSVPSDTEALDMAIRTELALGRPQEAAELVTRTILTDPLGAGAVRYGQRLLDRGSGEQAEKLVERIVRYTDLDSRLDVLVLSARANLAMGKLDEAEAILGSLATAHPDSFEVAMLGFDLGLARGQQGLVQGALATLKPIAPELFPDQLHDLAERLLSAGLDSELVEILDDEVCALPSARLSLREVAQAHKRLGEPARAYELLGKLPDDPDAMVDRFILLCLQGQVDEAARRLRLAPSSAKLLQARSDVCLLAANALMQYPALVDGTPRQRLDEMHAGDNMSLPRLELLDALLRLMPVLERLQDALPPSVVDSPRTAYPHAGTDVEALVALARTDPVTARRVCEDLLYLVLMQDRPFWADESRNLARHALVLLPGLAAPTRVLAAAELADGHPQAAMQLLQPVLDAGPPEPSDLDLFLRAVRECDHPEWGVAYVLQYQDQPGALLVLADALLDWGHAKEARQFYEQVLAGNATDAQAQAGLITALVDLRQPEDAVASIEQALTDHPSDASLAEVCGDALASLFKPTAKAVSLMQYLWSRHEDLDQVGEALARVAGNDTEALRVVLQELADRVSRRPPETDFDRAASHSSALVRAARTARAHELPDLARQLNELVLRTEPGAIALYRELGFLELEIGHPEQARAYLEVSSFVAPEDRDAAIELARLDFRQLGQPVRAADVVRRTFSGTIPPDMVEILAAEAWLLGRPTDAIEQFYKVSKSPLISADTYLTVTRIAYAAGLDDMARFTADLVLQNTAADDPRRARMQWLLDRRLPKPSVGKPTAAAGS